MTTLNSIEIRGIRSFTPDRSEFLQFESPLTLIVGKNGSGKTTLVECLKAVTCGILPPGQGKGKTFIYNNKLNNSSEVRASIKLSFNTHNNEKVSASRCYSLSRDKFDHKKMSFKGTDSTLNITSKDGKLRCLALKTTDMDTTVPSLMGMSRALLDNVIFCHQDENNWPLEDSSKVKSRFDDLLETARFTKALQSLNKARKEQDDMIFSKRTKLDAYKKQIMQISDLKNQIENNKEEIIKTKSEIKLFQYNLKHTNDEISILTKEYQEALILNNECNSAEKEYLRIKSECDLIHDGLSEIYEENIEEIKVFHSVLSDQLKDSEKENEKVTKKIENLSQKLDNYHERLRNITSSENNLLLYKEKLKHNDNTIEELKNELANELSLSKEEFDEDLVLSKINALDNFKHEDKLEEIERLEDEVNTLQTSILNKKAEIGGSNVMLKKLEYEIEKNREMISEFEEFNGLKDELNEKINTYNKEIEKLENQLKGLLNEKEIMLSKGHRMKNMIKIKEDINKEEIISGIRFLSYIINNDNESVESYKNMLKSYNLDDERLFQIIKRIFDGIALSGDKIIEDTKDTVKELFKSTVYESNCFKSGEKAYFNTNDSLFEPYNELVKLLTNKRIKEYISYFESLLKEEKEIDYDTDFDINKYNNLLSDIEITKQELSTKRLSVDVNNKELANVLLKIDKINECLVKESEMNLNKNTIIENIKEWTEKVNEQQTNLDINNNKLKELKDKKTQLENEYKSKYNKCNNLYNEFQKTKVKNESINQQINDLSSQNYSNCLENLNVDVDKLNNDIKSKKESQNKLVNKINEKKRLIQLLSDNLNYKIKYQLLVQSEAKYYEAKGKLASKEIENIKSKIEKLTKESSKLSHSIATLNGMLITREENVNKLTEMMENNTYSKTQSEYIDTYIELKSHIMAKMDLEKYSKYLESALHNYHRKKINDINCVLKRIWREIYTGNHIDYIEIQSKVDKDLLPLELESSCYNYRVVMITPSGIELDMKGHCSAGERLLSSLVVRIALIECFSGSCSILALDEPTTNLDKDNIQGLENSLSRLVNESNLNFQLLIITHDENFATKMATLCSCDKYFKLVKNESYTQIKTVTF